MTNTAGQTAQDVRPGPDPVATDDEDSRNARDGANGGGDAEGSHDTGADDADGAETWRGVVGDLLALDRAVVDDVVEDSGLLGVQADLLIRLSRIPDHRSPMNALAGSMRVSGSSLTKLVDRLSELGYARRDASENDRRVVYVVLTAAGVAEAERLRTRYAQVLRARVLASVGGGIVGLAGVARRLA